MTRDHDAKDQYSASARSALSAVEHLEHLVESRIGKTLAHRFLLQRVLAIGGMAAVYEATQAPLMRQVAIKILHPKEIEAGRSDLFLLEANAASNLRHPNIISIVDFGQEPDGTLFLAMEYVPGLDLGEVIQHQFPLAPERIVHIGEQVCLALEVAHNAGVVHCDMKPSNVMIEVVQGNPDFVKVVDFGISRSISEEPEPDSRPDEVLGSYAFMAPEQFLNQQIGPHTDVYGLGAVLYATLTATAPFLSSGDDAQLIREIIQTPVQSPTQRRPDLSISPALSAVIMRALSKNPADRYRSASHMRSALLASLYDAPDTHSEPIDENALEILFPETSDFPDLKALDRSFDEDDDVAWDFSLQAEGASIPSDFPDFQNYPLEETEEEIIELGDPVRSSFSISGLSSFTGLSSTHDAPLIGREHALEQLWQAVQRTRRGSLILALTGDFGSGRSFFLQRSCALIRDETNSIVIPVNFSPLDKEHPYRSLYHILRACLSFYEDQDSEPLALSIEANQTGPQGVHTNRGAIFGIQVPESSGDYSSPPITSVPTSTTAERLTLLELDLGEMETLVLETLLLRWQDNAPQTEKPFETTPLRFPEVRQSLLQYAFQSLLRRLLTIDSEMTDIPGERNPMILVIDGWDHCDTSSASILRSIIQENRSLPLLLILSQDQNPNIAFEELPEDSPEALRASASAIPWSDLHIFLPPLNVADTQKLLTHTTGVEAPKEFAQRIHKITRGNPLFARALLAFLSSQGKTRPKAPYEIPEDIAWPSSIQGLLTQQLQDLHPEEREVLLYCSLLGQIFSRALLIQFLPERLRDPAFLNALIQARVLEPSSHKVLGLQFRIPATRSVLRAFFKPATLQTMYKELEDTLVQLGDDTLPRGEIELQSAVCALYSPHPENAIHRLFESAHSALQRWEPESALRRTRQIQLWVARQFAQHQTAEENVLVLGTQDTATPQTNTSNIPPEDLQRFSIQATTLLFHVARLLYHPPTPHTLIPDRLPHHFLERITTVPAGTLSPAVLSLAALEVGKFLAVRSLPQSARAALQTAMVYAREGTPNVLLVDIELQLARNLHQLGHTGRVSDLCSDILQRIRALPTDTHVPPVLITPIHLSQPLDLLARLHIDRRQFPRAEHYLDQARACAEADQKHDLLHEIYLHYGHLYHAQNQLQRTLRVLRMALESARINHNLRAQARTLYNIGITCARVNQRTDAHHYFKHSYQIALSLGWADFLALIDDQLRKLH